MAACDLDSKRVEDAKTLINGYYAKKTGKPYDGVTDLQRTTTSCSPTRTSTRSSISTPDHWHAIIAIDAVQAGKDVYLQKPASLTIAEGRALSDAVHRSGRIFQIGSQQRSSPQFRYAAELVRNGRIGQLKTVEVGLPGDPSGDDRAGHAGAEEPELRHVARLDAGRAVHREARAPAGRLRPARLAALRAVRRRHDHRAGARTTSTARTGAWTRSTPGPVEVWGTAEFPKKGLWDVHGPFRTEAIYANGVHMIVSGDFPNGIKFIGTEGWIFVSRGNETVTASDPVAKLKDSTGAGGERSEDHHVGDRARTRSICYESKEHHGNWLECVRSRQQPIAPVEVAHRACSACLLHHIAMKAKRKLYWDPLKERFKNDDEANALLSRPQRAPYTIAQT